MIHYCAVYIIVDFLVIFISFFAIKKVKIEAQKLIDKDTYKEYKQEAQLALADILYLPQEFESDEIEEEIWDQFLVH